MGRPEKFEDWFHEAVSLMARTGVGLKQAATELEVALTHEECQNILRRSSFLKLLWEARHRYFTLLGSDPNFKKDTVIGKLINLAQKLEEEGQHDKAGEVWFKVSKMEGWVGPDSTVNVFGDLTDRDLKAIRENLDRKAAPIRTN